jgi:hypothetical protein
MILLGCLVALGLAVAPRVFLVIAWIFADRWPVVWGDAWIAPLLGIIFLPYTTVMYLLAWTPIGISGTLWLWILLGLFLDATHYIQAAQHRNRVPGLSRATASVPGSGPVDAPGESMPVAADSVETPADPLPSDDLDADRSPLPPSDADLLETQPYDTRSSGT